MTTGVRHLPAGSASTRPLWAAITVLGVAVIALGASLIHVNTRPIDGHAVFATPDLDTGSGQPGLATPEERLPVTTVAPNEAVVAPAPARPALQAPKPRNTGGADKQPAPESKAAPAPTRTPVVSAPRTVDPAPAGKTVATDVTPAPDTAPAPYVVTDAGLIASQSVAMAPVPRVPCATCGKVESVTAIQRKGTAQGVGAVAGGVLGAVVGNQIGKGSGRAVATILGAVGGGVAGNAVEKNMHTVTVYLVRVRMEDGSLRTVEQAAAPAIGSAVVVDGQTLRGTDAGTSTSVGTGSQPVPQAKVYSTERN